VLTDAAVRLQGEVYGPDRLLGRAAARPGDAGDRKADRRAEAAAGAASHLARRFLGDGAETLERRRIHAENLFLFSPSAVMSIAKWTRTTAPKR
jgi:hypothetical protein